ncbi:Dynlt1 [Symbiodinium sp. KB8]|nr:Dynlt1 [Symbiodinium sp. KB8]
MDELRASDESAFVQEEVEDCVRKILEGYLTDAVYDDSKVEHWIDIICADSLRELASLQKPFKYIVSCVIMQNTGAGLTSHQATYCDAVNDGVSVIKWPSDKQSKEQNQLYCVVTVFGCQL